MPPGLTRTPASAVRPAAEFVDTQAHQAVPRPLTPGDTAAVVAMLARDEAEALTRLTFRGAGICRDRVDLGAGVRQAASEVAEAVLRATKVTR